MKLTERMIQKNHKIVIFDSCSYIELGKKGISIEDILSKEQNKGIRGFISLWMLAETLSGTDKITLNNIHRHCFDGSCGWRLLADPVAQVYFMLYKEEPTFMQTRKKEIEYLFDKALNNGLSEEERNHIKAQLEKTGDPFVKDCQNNRVDIKKLNSVGIQREAIRQIIHMAKGVHSDLTGVEDNEINLFVNQFPAAGAYYELLTRDKFTQKKLNKDGLLHDQRDWTLVFYAGIDNIYIVTEENRIKRLGFKNVFSLEEYLSGVIQI